MDFDELNLTAYSLVMKIQAITGWPMPDTEIVDILTDQLAKKLEEAYPNVNAEEIEYAFRNYGSQVKNWGANFNLNILDEVISPYLEQRADVSRIEEQLNKPKELPAAVEKLTDEQRIADAKETFLATGMPLLIPISIWPLVKDKITLTEPEKEEIRKQAKLIVQKMADDDKFLFKDKPEKNWINRVMYQLTIAKYFKQ